MPRGKKYNDDVREKALALLTVNNSVSAVAGELGIPEATLRSWKKAADEDPDGEFAKVRAIKKGEFVNDAWRVIGLGINLLGRRLKRALENEDQIDALEREAYAAERLGVDNRKKIAANLAAIRCEDISKVSAVIGTLYDKQALLAGDAARNEPQVVQVIFEKPEDAKYAE